eukprot:7440646-Pyramimonas_sp.AAC.1
MAARRDMRPAGLAKDCRSSHRQEWRICRAGNRNHVLRGSRASLCKACMQRFGRPARRLEVIAEERQKRSPTRGRSDRLCCQRGRQLRAWRAAAVCAGLARPGLAVEAADSGDRGLGLEDAERATAAAPGGKSRWAAAL